jgi:hypothetical protein
MNTKLTSSFLRRASASLAVFGLLSAFFIGSPDARAQSGEKFYFWVTGAGESFVIEVDAQMADTIRTAWKSKAITVRGQIAAGAAEYNKDYQSPTHRVWNWHFASVEGVVDLNSLFPQCECPYLKATPSQIDANPDEWIKQNGTYYSPILFAIVAEIDPSKKDAVANVSNRGLSGAGERTLITGLIVSGGQPRNIVVRALGPSLSSSGIQQAAANPKLVVFRGSQKLATNADWKTDARANSLAQNYPSLAPTNDKEAAMLLTLLPGSYTLQGINEDGTEGIMLLEAYDVDSTIP